MKEITTKDTRKRNTEAVFKKFNALSRKCGKILTDTFSGKTDAYSDKQLLASKLILELVAPSINGCMGDSIAKDVR